MGGGLIAPLMTFTADTTEALLRLTGVPVFRESMYLMLPTGTWSVIEECSGVRYLIASFTLGLLYAYLTYRSLWRRTIFVAVAIIVPILANSLRAYGVVMVGHLSEMRFGIGGDHLIYGWAFFGLVMMLMFWIGGFWQQSVAPAATSATPTSPAKRGLALPLVVCLAILCAGIWPGLALMLNRNAEELTSVVLESPAAQGHWQAHHDANWSWQPAIEDADRELDQIYIAASSDERHVVGLHIRQYLQQRRGVELVSGIEPWRPDRRRWLVLSQQSQPIELHDAVQVDEVQLSSSEQKLLVWSWYRVAGRDTASPYAVKLYEAIQQFLEGRRHGARIFIATPLGSDVNQARSILQNFVATHYNAISASLDEGASP